MAAKISLRASPAMTNEIAAEVRQSVQPARITKTCTITSRTAVKVTNATMTPYATTRPGCVWERSVPPIMPPINSAA